MKKETISLRKQEEVASLLLDRLDDQAEELADFVARFVRVPSESGDETAAAEFVEDWFAQNGIDSERQYATSEDVERWPDFAHELNLDRRPNVIGRIPSIRRAVRDVVINGHMDVVPAGPEEDWTYPPYAGVRKDGIIYGRGTADMKGGLAAGLFAARAILQLGLELPFDLQLQCVIAEESGGLGTVSLANTIGKPAAVMVLEPTDSKILTALGGALPFTVSVVGSAAHVGAPWNGVDAFDKLLLVIQRLKQLEKHRQATLKHPLFDVHPRSAPFSVGIVEAGEWRLTIPGTARFLGRIGSMPFETVEEVRAQVVAAIDEVNEGDEWLREHPCTITWDGPGFEGWETPMEEPVVVSVLDAMKRLGGDSNPVGQSAGSDAATYAKAGVPVIQFGPGSEAHVKDECVSEAEVLYIAKVTALSLLNLAAIFSGNTGGEDSLGQSER